MLLAEQIVNNIALIIKTIDFFDATMFGLIED